MKLLVIGTDTTIFDASSPTRARIEEYARLFDEYHVVVYTEPGFMKEVISDTLVMYPANSRFFFLRPFQAFRIAGEIIKKRGTDVVSVQDPMESGIAGWFLKKKYGVPLHVQIHADVLNPFFRSVSWRERVRYMIAKCIIPRADHVRVVSRRIEDSLKSKIKNKKLKITVLPIFVDRAAIVDAHPSFNLRERYPQFDFIILMVNRLVREKNVSLALEVFREFLNEFPKTGLVIVGDGPERKKLESGIRNQELGNNVWFEGWQDDLVSYYKTADLYLLTSDFEGYGRTVVEAAAAGLPVVMTDVGVARDIIRNRDTGLVVPPKDKGTLLGALLWARKNYGEMRTIAHRAQDLVMNLTPRTRQEYLEMYHKSFL